MADGANSGCGTMHRSPLLVAFVAAFGFFVLGPTARGQAVRDLLIGSPGVEPMPIAMDTPVVRTRRAAFDASALEAPVERLRIELFDDVSATFSLEKREVRGPGEMTWTGVLVGGGEGRATFALADGALCGTVRVRDRLWRVRSEPGGDAVLEAIDERRVPPCSTTAAERRTFPNAPPPAPSLPPSPSTTPTFSTIDVMVVYTPAARAGQGGTAAMNALIDLAVLESNQAYALSGVNQKLRLVQRGELAGYVSAGWPTDLGRLHDPADGWLDYIFDWRAQSGADVVVLIEDAAGGNCGVSFLMGTLTTAFAPDAFSIVSRTCATGYYTFSHELGHQMGLGHDRDYSTDKIMRASYSTSLAQGNGPSYSPVVSRFGRFVAFLSDATNLVANDTNAVADVFLRDRDMFTTVRVNVGPGGVQANGSLLSAPAVSQSGALVAFDCTATNLLAGDTNGQADVFVRDVANSATERVSVGAGGVEANGASYDPAISADGRFVAFASDASNLVAGAAGTQVYVRDRTNGTTSLVSTSTLGGGGNGGARRPAISADGRFVAFTSTANDLVAGDTNNKADVFVRNMQTGVMVRASVSNGGVQASGDSPFTPGISGDGRYVVFTSIASDLVLGDTNANWDVFVFDRVTVTTVRASVGPGGVGGNGPSGWMARPSITDDGRYVAFSSRATNLLPGDTNGSDDVFVRDMQVGTSVRVSVTASGQQHGGNSGNVDQNTTTSISAMSGDAIVFVSSAPLEIIDSNNLQDAYVFRMSQPDPPGIEDYAYGYRTPDSAWRTIMAYQPGVRLQYFSNPAVSHAGQPLGIAAPDPYSAEAWRALNESAPTVAAFVAAQYTATCLGDGSGTACPCGNASVVGVDSGCLNSTGNAGHLEAIGTASIASDTVLLRASGMPDSSALYFQGTQAVGAGSGAVFGDGLRCAGGNVQRLATKTNVQGASSLPNVGDAALATLGALTGPGTAVYQVWYRNAAAYCSPSTFNLTNGLAVSWKP